ncbi:DUF4912 domain-containing protein [Candidatus Sumerlaeota bacterium]|nr:DUF4912 domain-containing protein [Candidatus Sumerlaeota bacterium]
MAKATGKTTAKKTTSAKKTAAKKPAARTAPKTTVAKKAAVKKTSPKKTTAKKAAAKTAAIKKTTVKRVAAASKKPKATVKKTARSAPAPASPPREQKAKKAFSRALGAWAEDEMAVLARSGAEHESLRRAVSREAVESKKFEIQSASAEPADSDTVATEFDQVPLSFPMAREIDDLYDETRLTILVRDPEWVFAYWDIDTETRKRLGIPRGRHNRRMAIRWYDVTDIERFDGHNAHRTMEIEISDAARSWYQKMPEANRYWLADLGLFDDHGHFVAICRSNLVRMPRMRMAPAPREGGAEPTWMHVEHGPAAPSGKVPRKRILQPGEVTVSSSGHRLVEPSSELTEFLGATELRVKPAERKPGAPTEDIFPGASEQLMGGASEGLMGGASERLVDRKK